MERERGGRPRYPGVLTPAEQRVREELRNGGSNAEIAARLGISRETVKTHIASMLSKLDLADRRELAAWRPGEEGTARRWSFAPLLKPLAGVGQAAVVVVLAVVLIFVFQRGGEETVVALPPVADITLSAGPETTCVVREPGAVVCWGTTAPARRTHPRAVSAL